MVNLHCTTTLPPLYGSTLSFSALCICNSNYYHNFSHVLLLMDFKTLVWVDTVVPWPWQQYCLCSVTVLHTTLQEGETDFTIPVASVHNVSQLHRWDLLHLRSKTEGCHDNQLGRKEQKLVINLINAFIYIPTLATLPSVSTDWLVERRLQNLTFWARVSTKTASPFMSWIWWTCKVVAVHKYIGAWGCQNTPGIKASLQLWDKQKGLIHTSKANP